MGDSLFITYIKNKIKIKLFLWPSVFIYFYKCPRYSLIKNKKSNMSRKFMKFSHRFHVDSSTVFERIILSNIHVDSTILIYVVITWISRTVFVGIRTDRNLCDRIVFYCNDFNAHNIQQFSSVK